METRDQFDLIRRDTKARIRFTSKLDLTGNDLGNLGYSPPVLNVKSTCLNLSDQSDPTGQRSSQYFRYLGPATDIAVLQAKTIEINPLPTALGNGNDLQMGRSVLASSRGGPIAYTIFSLEVLLEVGAIGFLIHTYVLYESLYEIFGWNNSGIENRIHACGGTSLNGRLTRL